MSNDRPAIPAELRRRVLVEAGHRCAIPTCRYIEVDAHHIIPWEQCKKHEYENLIALCPNCHRRTEKGEIDRKSLRLYKANLRYTHDRFSQLEVDVLFNAYKLKSNEVILWPEYLMVLLKRLLEAGYVKRTVRKPIGQVGGLKLNADHLTLTGKGREFIESLGLNEL